MVEPTAPQSELKTYLVHFRQHWKLLDFCLQELESLADKNGVTKEQLYVNDPNSFDPKVNPTVYVRLPSDEVCKKIAARSVLIKEIIDVFSEEKLSRKSRERSWEREAATEEAKTEEEKKIEKQNADPMVMNYELLVANTDAARLIPHLTQGKKPKFMLEGIDASSALLSRLPSLSSSKSMISKRKMSTLITLN